MNKGHNLLVILLVLILILPTSGCTQERSEVAHTNEWSEAACSHEWAEATCKAPRVCLQCEMTEGTPLAHTWAEATYSAPCTCVICGEVQGVPLERRDFGLDLKTMYLRSEQALSALGYELKDPVLQFMDGRYHLSISLLEAKSRANTNIYIRMEVSAEPEIPSAFKGTVYIEDIAEIEEFTGIAPVSYIDLTAPVEDSKSIASPLDLVCIAMLSVIDADFDPSLLTQKLQGEPDSMKQLKYRYSGSEEFYYVETKLYQMMSCCGIHITKTSNESSDFFSLSSLMILYP